MMDQPTRIKACRSTATIAFLQLFFVFLLQEIIIFGFKWGFLFGAHNADPYLCSFGIGWTISIQMFNAFVGAILIFFASLAFYKTRVVLPAKATSYTLAFAWGCLVTAGSYSGCFGTTWLWYEPVKELLFDPILTTLFYLGGLVTFIWMVRGQQNARAKSAVGE